MSAVGSFAAVFGCFAESAFSHNGLIGGDKSDETPLLSLLALPPCPFCEKWAFALAAQSVTTCPQAIPG